MRLSRTCVAITVLLGVAACRGVRPPSPESPATEPEPLADPRVTVASDDPYVPPPKPFGTQEIGWHYGLESARVTGAAEHVTTPVGGGVRVAVVESPGLPGSADAHAVAEGVPAPVPVGEATWPAGPYVSPFARDPIWRGARVRIDWLVTLTRRGRCFVEMRAVPRLTTRGGCVALLEELRVVRVLGLGEAIVLVSDPDDPARDTGSLLVGSPPGRKGSLVLRVSE